MPARRGEAQRIPGRAEITAGSGAPSECGEMNHLSDEQLILHYYGEESDAPGAEMHLDQCAECREMYGSLQRVLNVVDTLPVPARSPEYGAEVFRRIEHRLPAQWWGRLSTCGPIVNRSS